MSLVEVLRPLEGTPPKVVLANALEECGDNDVVFVIRISGEDSHITSSTFKTSQIAWAAAILNGYAVHEAVK